MLASVYTISSENDKNQLPVMLDQLESELAIVPEELLADAGYYVINQLEELESNHGIKCFVPIHHNQQANKGGFQYHPTGLLYLFTRRSTKTKE